MVQIVVYRIHDFGKILGWTGEFCQEISMPIKVNGRKIFDHEFLDQGLVGSKFNRGYL